MVNTTSIDCPVAGIAALCIRLRCARQPVRTANRANIHVEELLQSMCIFFLNQISAETNEYSEKFSYFREFGKNIRGRDE